MKDSPEENGMCENERLMRAFCHRFSPELKYCRTDRHNGVRVHNAWMCGYSDPSQSIGLTVISYNGQLNAYLELHVTGEQAAALGGTIYSDAIRRMGANPNA